MADTSILLDVDVVWQLVLQRLAPLQVMRNRHGAVFDVLSVTYCHWQEQY